MDAPRAARGASRTDLEEALQSIRRALAEREDAPSGAWVEETAQELAAGTKPGWYFPAASGGGLAFYARRGEDAFGHVDAGPGPNAEARAERLATTLLDGFPEAVRSANVGFTSLAPDVERGLVERLARRPGSVAIERLSLERPLSEPDGRPVAPPPGVRLLPVRDVTVESLADLDRRAFVGSVDELLIGPTIDEYRQVLAAILDGRLGRFVDEASVALVEPEPLRLVGAALTTEQSIHRGILADLVVDPDRRRHGLGRFLIAWVDRALFALGYESVRLWVSAANAPARGLYDRFGFRTIGGATLYRWSRPPAASHPQPGR